MHFRLWWVLGALACSHADDSAAAAAAAATAARYDCENRVGSALPCPGLLPQCPSPGPNVDAPQVVYDPEYMPVEGLTDCVGEHFHERGTIEYSGYPAVPESAAGFSVRLEESGCYVGVTADVSVGNAARGPAWLRLSVGQQLDVDVWDARGLRRGGSGLWLILRSLDTSELLFTLYRSRWELIEEGTVRDLLGFDAAVTEPTCEDFDSSQVLTHLHALRFQTELSSVVLGTRDVNTLRLGNGRRIRVQSDGSVYAYAHLLEYPVVDTILGPQAYFAAWPE